MLSLTANEATLALTRAGAEGSSIAKLLSLLKKMKDEMRERERER